jgi:excisionase family DNA binding protein
MDSKSELNKQSDLFTRREASAYLGVATTTLAMWKCNGRYQLPVVKIGGLCKYRKSDLDEFITRSTLNGELNA